ncbi:DUF4191 domain-containing protein [Lysinibacter sp. HNR]|uniref:DUF4191 domain-containing protein n=1 Tax=Lysinibacter sp. HNR TaxID=3031408 RepID=UPI002434832A|nr:DUF4191 domain-containing protein [Lysinibacter sp. HNR]WGD36167.1 DUF4191 domain-containing protein [Lysinibacter sp. HNR]
MAKPKDDTVKTKKTKKPSRIKQMWQVFQMTRRYDSNITLVLLICFFVPILVSVALILFVPGTIFSAVLWVLAGILLGLLIALIVLGRRAERAAYAQIEGEPGAVGAVIKNGLRRSWRGNEVPVALNPRTKDAVYRVTGKGGVVLIAEGPYNRVQRLLSDEERKIRRSLPTVQVTHLIVGPDEDSVPLWRLARDIRKTKSTLTRQEVVAVSNRLNSLQSTPVGIPKGIDPNKVRAPRPR